MREAERGKKSFAQTPFSACVATAGLGPGPAVALNAAITKQLIIGRTFAGKFPKTVRMRLKYFCLGLVLLAAPAAHASGFDSGPQGARLLGLGGAGTAYTGSLAAFGTNAALLGQWADSATHLSFGGAGVLRRASFVGLASNVNADQDLTVLPNGYLYASRAVSKNVVLGLALTTPYGYHTRWADQWEGRAVVQESRLNTYFVQPTVAFRLTENFSIGAGVVYAYGKFSQRRALGQYDDPAAQARFGGSGSGLGGTVGLYGRTGDNLSFGLSYRTGLKLKVNSGTAEYANVPARDAALYAASTSLNTSLNLPSTLAIGIANRINESVLLTFDFALTGWSTLDSLNFDLAAAAPTPARRVADGRHFEDALAFRIGTELRATPALTILGGLRYDETPVRDEYIRPDFVDANRLGASVGLAYQLAPRLALEAAYSFEYGQLRTARADASATRVSNVAGTYRTATNTVSVGVSTSF